MKALNIDETALPAYVAIADAKAKHEANWPLHTVAKQQLSLELKALASAAYFRSKTYLNAREKFITVTVKRPNVRDKLQNVNEFNALEAFIKQHKIDEPRPTGTALLYRIKK